jgi:NitT/TauT family transport system substrate-binding protein
MTARLATFALLLATLLCAVGLGGCARGERPGYGLPESETAGLEPVTLALNWYAEAAHAGFYQAVLDGRYREAGLDVRIVPGSPAAFPLQRTLTGQADFAIDSLENIVAATDRGLPVAVIGVYMQTDPQAFLLHADDPVRTFADLDGRTVMSLPNDASLQWIQRRFGITVHSIPNDFGVERFIREPGFIQKCYITSQPFTARQAGVAIRTLLVSDSGFDPPGVVYMSLDLATRRPELARKFMRASLRGWRDYLHGDASRTHALLLKLNQANTPELLAYSRGAMREAHIIEGDPARGRRLGLMDPARFSEALAALHELGLAKRPPSSASCLRTPGPSPTTPSTPPCPPYPIRHDTALSSH